MGLNAKERAQLFHVAAQPEKELGTKRIDEMFTPEFFQTKFWYMWDTMYVFRS
jgi:oleate hydratase